VAGKCLSCHTLLGERVKAGLGLHARSDYRDCKTCHVEHQGTDFDLVYWGKTGRAAFDHATTGHALEGKHQTLTCEGCHQSRFNRLSSRLASGRASPRTFLGLGTACSSCHADPHQGTRFAGRECRTCHTQQAFKPAPGFDHGATGFVLAGRHQPLRCEKCHAGAAPSPAAPVAPSPAGRAAPMRVLSAVKGRECQSCHEDVHRGKLGAACASCHVPSGWRDRTGPLVAGRGFDHDRTDYALRGKHAAVACAACHPAGRSLRVKHERCSDCHSDRHYGQLARRADQGRCESCHDVAGFAPARFALEDHQKTGYPLAGAHLAVPCDGCHRGVSPESLVPAGVRMVSLGPSASPGRGRLTALFRFAATRCTDCHRDPHKGEVDRLVAKGGCESCHRVDSWRATSFDHATTRFLLNGGHAKPGCSACHQRVDKGTPRERVRLTGLLLACESCHKDPHAGQFARAGASVACDRCHTTSDVRASGFEHNRDAAYKLDGAHARVACGACHAVEKRAGQSFVRYKPLGQACKDCHLPTLVGGAP
jgi:hypothetical protein